MSESEERRRLEQARTFLFVPGTRQDRFDKAVASGADVVILDLEDTVAAEDKEVARSRVAAWLAAGGQAAVRVNAVSSPWFDDDVAAVAGAVGLVLPKCEGAADLGRVAEAGGPDVAVIPLVESPQGLFAVSEICAATGVVRLGFGHVDFCAEVGLDPASHVALATARSMLVYASCAASLAAPVDGVTTALDDEKTLRADVRHARELGFTAKLLIHPRQVGVAAEELAPTAAEVAWARGVVASATAAVGVHDGHLVDEPVLVRARRLLERAGVAG